MTKDPADEFEDFNHAGPQYHLRSRAIQQACAAARTEAFEEAAKMADDWLKTFGDTKPQHVSAQKWASDAIADIRDAIRALASAET